MSKIASTRPVDGDFASTHIISMEQFEAPDIMRVVEGAADMEAMLKDKGKIDILKNHILIAMMEQDSSRTGGSFVSAMESLGGSGRIPDLGRSSANKGEDFLHSVVTYATQSDVLVIRSDKDGSVTEAAEYLEMIENEMLAHGNRTLGTRIINAGDGKNEHPSQTFVDLTTMYRHFGHLSGLRLTLVGAAAEYRAAHSLAIGASRFGMTVNIVTPDVSPMPDKYLDILTDRGCPVTTDTALMPFVAESDVIYCMRPAMENVNDDARKAAILKAYEGYTITPEVMQEAPEGTIVMHPMPINREIARGFDTDPRARYFDQMAVGIPVRMEMLVSMFDKPPQDLLPA